MKLISLISAAAASSTYGESCPDSFPIMQNFDKNRLVGNWYVAKQDFSFSGPCTTAKYTAKSNGDIAIGNRTWVWWFFFSYFNVSGVGKCPSSEGKCWVDVSFWGNEDSPDITGRAPNYNVVDTDYDNYILIYNCSKAWHGGKSEAAWLMTREKTPAKSSVNAWAQIFKNKVPLYNHENFDDVTQGDDDCTYDFS